MALAPYATPVERAWYYTFRVLCALVLLFLIAPILVIMPLSLNSEPYFTYPLPALSLRWYEDFFTSERWQIALQNSVIVACATTVLATVSAQDRDANRYLARLGFSSIATLRGASVAALRGGMVPLDPPAWARTDVRTRRTVGQILAQRRQQRRANGDAGTD